MTDSTGQIIMEFPPATRISHPETSRIAEGKITKTGRRQKHCQIILQALRRHNGSTTKELAGFLAGVLRHDQIWRRMNDLFENEYVKPNNEIKREGCQTWWLL